MEEISQPSPKTPSPNKVLLAVVAVLAVALIAALVLLIISVGQNDDSDDRRRSKKSSSSSVVTQPSSSMATQPTTTVPTTTAPATTAPSLVTDKEKYTVSDMAANVAHDQVVATMGEYELTNGQLQVFLWMQAYSFQSEYYEMYGESAMYYLGLDLEKPLYEQTCAAKPGMTWEQYFIEDALYAWLRYQSAADEAKKAGYKLPAEYQQMLNNSRATLEESAKSNGYASVDAMLQGTIGKTVTFEDYYYYQVLYMTSELYTEAAVSRLVFTDKDLDEYFKKHAEEYAQYGVTQDSGKLVDYLNILIKPVASKDSAGNTIYTDQAWYNSLTEAQNILVTWLNGNRTAETFATLAKLKSDDKNTASNGGLNQYVQKNSLATVDVRHILIMPSGTKNADGTVTYSEEDWEACRIAAQAVLNEYLAGVRTEAAFSALANKYSDDKNGNVTDGGIYSDVKIGQMVKPFEEWIFADGRQTGETGLVKTDYGYHVMYFVERNAPVDDWLFAEERKPGDYELLKTDDGYQIVFYVGDELTWKVACYTDLQYEVEVNMKQTWIDAHPVEVNYQQIKLSERTTSKTAAQ